MKRLTSAIVAISFLSTSVFAAAPPSASDGVAPVSIRAAAEKIQFGGAPSSQVVVPLRRPRQQSTVRQRAKVIVASAVVGGIVGSMIGYFGTRDCHCDDPGLGIVFGFPPGLLAGALVGVVIANR